MSHSMTKQRKWAASRQNQQNDLCAQRRLRLAWASTQYDQSSLCAQWVAKDPSFIHADSEDSDQTGRMPRLICVFAGRTFLLVLSCTGSNDLCGQQRHRSAWAFSLGMRPVWSQSSLSSCRKFLPLATHKAHNEDWSNWENAQADLISHVILLLMLCYNLY